MNRCRVYIAMIILVAQSCSTSKITGRSTYESPWDAEIKNWDFFLEKQPLKICVIDYIPTNFRCTRGTFHTVAIVKYNATDSIRILDYCPNFSNFQPGDSVTFYPETLNPIPPSTVTIYPPGGFIDKYRHIKKTTYGKLR